jgi:hypothetical protein
MYALAEDGNAVRTSVHGQCAAHVNLFPTSRLFWGLSGLVAQSAKIWEGEQKNEENKLTEVLNVISRLRALGSTNGDIVDIA